MNDLSKFLIGEEMRIFRRNKRIAIAALFIFAALAGLAKSQTIGDTQLGVQEIDIEFHNSYKTDTVVVVGDRVNLHFASPFLYDSSEREQLRIVREWPGVEWKTFIDVQIDGDHVAAKVYPGCNQILRLEYGGVLSRRYFIVVLQDVPDLDVAAYKYRDVGVCEQDGRIDLLDRYALEEFVGNRWPHNYKSCFDFNNDGEINRIDWLIFEQGKYWR